MYKEKISPIKYKKLYLHNHITYTACYQDIMSLRKTVIDIATIRYYMCQNVL